MRARLNMVDMTGLRVGQWTVINRAENYKNGSAQWNCRCDCGNVRVVTGQSLRSGGSDCCKSCSSSHHGETRGGNSTAEWRIWRGILERCKPSGTKYSARYGDRGIRVCDRWSEFDNFLTDMGRRPSDGHSIDRIDNDGDYEPLNCRWATREEQARNTSTNVVLEFNGESMTAADWADRLDVPRHVIYLRLARGWTAERTLTEKRRNYPGKIGGGL